MSLLAAAQALEQAARDLQSLRDQTLFRISGTDVTIGTLITVGIVIIVTLLVSRIVRRILERVVIKRADPLARSNLQVTIRLVQYVVLAIGLMVALEMIGVRLTALFAAGALFAVAIGFAMQNVTSNFISGVILLLERSIKPGDVIEVDGQIVQIKEMGIRAAVARTLNEEDLIIPSSNLVQATVKNYTLRDPLARIRVIVGVTYGSDMAVVRRALEETANGVSWRSKVREPVVHMREFGDSSVNFEVSVWFEDPWRRNQRNSDLHEAIWWALKDAGVTIAFPQLDVHFDPPVVEAWERSGPS